MLELELIRFKQHIFNFLTKYNASKTPNNFLLWNTSPNDDKPIQYNDMIDALNNDDETLVMEYISNFSEKELSDLHNFFLTELMYQRKLYNALNDFKYGETPDTLFKMYLNSTTPDEFGYVRSETDRITFLNLLTALNDQDDIMVIAFITHMSDKNLYYILQFFKEFNYIKNS